MSKGAPWPCDRSVRGSVVEAVELSHRVGYIGIMTDDLAKLLEAAKTAKPTPEHREQQRRSFVFGNTHFENDLISRELVDREADTLAKDQK